MSYPTQVEIPLEIDRRITPNGRRPWSAEEIETLTNWYSDHSLNGAFHLDDLADQLSRSRASVACKAGSLGLTDRRRPTVDVPETVTRIPNDDGTVSFKHRRKYETDEELRAAISESRKAHIALHGHPRGALGMRHTEEVKRAQSQRSLAQWARMSDDDKEVRRVKRLHTNLERHGTGHPGLTTMDNPYSRGHRGYIEDIPGIFFRSGWEANYARYLDWLISQGEIASWTFESETFVFHGVTRAPVTYTPDFRVVETDGSVIFHEVKGWMDGPSKSKLKRMKKYYPDVKIIVVDEAAYKAIAKWASIIPCWGDMPKTKKQLAEEAAT